MIRKFKALGLALVAICAMSALVASAAQAFPGTLTTFPTGKTVIVTGEQTGEHEFRFTDHLIGGEAALTKCKKATFTGTWAMFQGDTSVNVTPAYTECIAFGQAATITTTGCTYALKFGTLSRVLIEVEGETVTVKSGGWQVVTDVVCTGAAVIKIVTGTCEVTIGAQTGLVSSEMTSSGLASPETAMDLLLHTNITGIKYTVVKDNIGCPLTGTGSFSKGDYSGTTTVKAHDATTKAAVGITLHGLF